METKNISLSKQALQRLPNYLNFLKSLKSDNIAYISSPAIADALELNEVQVRKDMAKVSRNQGIPKKGFLVSDLIKGISDILGYNNVRDAVLVGAGHLGKALLQYNGFKEYGIDIVAAFDTNESIVGETVNNKPIFHTSKLSDLCKRLKIKMAIITVPEDSAQEAFDLLINNGVLAVWNFTPKHLKVPEGILVHNENMAASLALLSNHLKDRLD